MTQILHLYYNSQKMLQSVYTNGGFWIGRYEAGNAANETTPASRENEYPRIWTECSEAQALASSVNSGNYTSSLMFGVQWDLVLKYLEVKAVEKGTELATIQNELNSNSTSWGNYYDNNYNITNTLAKYSFDDGLNWINAPYNKESSKMVLLTTGASGTFSKQNIYDIAGNVDEWTLEGSDDYCVYRGGDYVSTGSSDSASKRTRCLEQ